MRNPREVQSDFVCCIFIAQLCNVYIYIIAWLFVLWTVAGEYETNT